MTELSSGSKDQHPDPANNSAEERGLPVESMAKVGHQQGDVEDAPEEEDWQRLGERWLTVLPVVCQGLADSGIN